MPRLRRRPDPGSRQGPVGADEQTVRITRRQFARRQTARRWLTWRWVLLALGVAGAAGFLVWLFFFSAVLSVKGVTVAGTSVLTPKEVRAAAEVPLGEPLGTVDLDAIAARVEVLAPVREVEVTRAWPDRVRIDIAERETVAVVERDGGFRGLDDTGVIFRDYPRRPAGVPVVHMSASTRVDALVEVARVIRAMPASVADRVEYIDVETIDAISLRLDGGALVRWGSAEDSVSKAEVLAVLLAKKASVYDVTVPGRPTIRP